MATTPHDPQPTPPSARSPVAADRAPVVAGPMTANGADSSAAPADEGFTPLVAEIRQRLATIVARELDVQRRERELSEELRRATQAAQVNAQRDLLQARQRLDERSASLDSQAFVFSRRQTELDQQAAELGAREARLAQDRADLLRGLSRLRRRRTADRAQRHQERQATRVHETKQQRLDAELTQRLGLARDEIAAQRDELEQIRQTLEQRSVELDQRQQQLAAVATEVAPLRDELAQQQRELEAHRAALTRESEELTRERTAVQAQRTALDDRWREMRDQRGEAHRHKEDVAAQQRLIAQERQEYETRLSRLEARETRLTEQRRSLDSTRTELARHDAALRERQQALEELHARAARAEREVSSGQSALTTLRESLAIREATMREAAATLEIQAGVLATVQQATTAAGSASGAARPTPVTVRGAARRQRGTRAAVALVLAIAAGGLTWLNTPPLVRTSLVVPVSTQSADPNWALAQHAEQVTDDARVRRALRNPALRAAWERTSAAGQARVSPTFAPPALTVSVSGTDAAGNASLLSAIVLSYVRSVNNVPPAPQLPPAYRDLPARRDTVAAARTAAAAEVAQRRAVAAMPPTATQPAATQPATAEREARLAQIATLEESSRALTTQLATQRAALDRLSAATPGGIVTAEALQTALGSDASYHEDQKEYELAAAAYQRELTVAFQGLDAPLKSVQAALGTLRTAVQEQRAVPAPTDVGTVLEETQAEVERCTTQCAALGQAAPQWRQTAEALHAAEEASTLVELHNNAIETVRQTFEAGQTLGQHLQAAAEKLGSAGDGGTRQVVVAALLRSEARPLTDAVAALATAAKKMQFKENTELDAQDRKLRGVLARMNERTQLIKAQVQGAADAQAAREHAAQVDAARAAIGELSAKRETQLAEWGAALKALRDLDAQLGERRVLEAEAAASEREVKRLDAQLAAIDATLAEARRQGTHPDRLGPVPDATQEIITSPRRTPIALLMGGCTLAGMWLLLAWAVGDAWPLRRIGGVGRRATALEQ